MYFNPDNDPRGDWTSSNMVGLATKSARPNLHFDLIDPNTGVNYGCPPKGWRYERDTMARLAGENKILWPKFPTGRPRRKFFYSELVEEFTGYSSIMGEGIFTRHGTQDVGALLKNVEFAFPKPVALVHELLIQATESDSLVLDSFAGSGTSGHAVLAANNADGGNRRFILVEMDEPICRGLTAQRLRRAIEGNEDAAGLGGGFRYCKLSHPIFDEAGQIHAEVRFADLAAHVYFTETGEPMSKRPNGRTPLIGVCRGTAYYLLFNGVLGDRRPDGGNVLTGRVLEQLPAHEGPKVVYGEGSRIGAARLARQRITFKQVPYAIEVS